MPWCVWSKLIVGFFLSLPSSHRQPLREQTLDTSCLQEESLGSVAGSSPAGPAGWRSRPAQPGRSPETAPPSCLP